VTPLTSLELAALRSLRAAYPDTTIAIVGAVALRLHMDMTWRTSADIDLVIAVSASQIEASRLVGWKRHPRQPQRWEAPNGVLIDLVPAPPEALATRQLIWPETGNTMNLAGIHSALIASTSLLPPDLAIAVASIPVIALLKMTAYLDRPYEREKDLKDLAHILREHPPLSDERIFSDEIFSAGFDTTEAQAFILGREVAAVVDEHDRETVNAFLELMAGDVHFSRFANSSPWRYDDSELQKRIDAFQRGFTRTDSLARE
jgi:predicted nucleotidyltransferase